MKIAQLVFLGFLVLTITSCKKSTNNDVTNSFSNLNVPDGFDWSSNQNSTLNVKINGNGSGKLLYLYDLDGNKIDSKRITDNNISFSYSVSELTDTLRLYSPDNFLSLYVIANQTNAEFSFYDKKRSLNSKSLDYALDFNGETNYVKINNDGNAGMISGFPFSFSAWFKTPGPTEGNDDMVLVNIANPDYASKYYGICIRKYQDKYKAVIVARNSESERVKSFNQNLADDTWHQVVGVFQSEDSRKLYIDGVYTGESSSNVTFDADAIITTIGRWGDNTPSEYFHKLIDNVCIWDKELSDAEVLNYYSNSPSGTEEDLVGYWDFNEGAGTLANNLAITGGYNGDIYGAQYKATVNPEDNDGDGVTNDNDAFPDNPDIAFVDEYPYGNNFYFHLFEDLWPGKGDYDFNDIVMKTKLYVHLNSNNKLVGGRVNSQVYWIGGGIPRGVGMEWFKSNGSGNKLAYLPENTTSFAEPNNVVTDPAVNNAVKLFDGNIINSLNETVDFTFTWDNSLGGDLLNVMVYIYNSRPHEVHMYGYPPTSAADMSLFDTKDDASQTNWDWTPEDYFTIPADFYKTSTNLPWGLEIITDNFRVPNEKTPIIDAYPMFKEWAESGGTINKQWYKNPNNSLTFLPE